MWIAIIFQVLFITPSLISSVVESYKIRTKIDQLVDSKNGTLFH